MTSRSTPKLSEITRHVRVPSGVVSTGWPAVERKCADLGVTFRPWQAPAGRLILAKRADGKYAATIGGTGMSIPRQVGKTFLVGAIVFALCLIHPKLTVIWTAHRVTTADETFTKMQAFAKRKRIAPLLAKVPMATDEKITFRNGSRIFFGARDQGFGLGFDEVDVLIFDEAQRLKANTLDDMIPATNQSRQPTGALLLFMGTPPRPTDSGEVFTRMRTEALSGEDEDTGWIEFGADEDFKPTPAPAPLKARDWTQVAKANPSFPGDTTREAILRMRKKLGPESFLREGLGIWDKATGNAVDGLNAEMWAARSADVVEPDDLALVAFGVTVTPDRGRALVCVAGQRPDGNVQVAVAAEGPGTAWVANWLPERVEAHTPVAVVLDGLASALEIPLMDRGVDAKVTTTVERARAGAAFWDAFHAGAITNAGQAGLDDSVRTSERKFLSEGFVWQGPLSAPLAGVTLAYHGLMTTPAPQKAPEPFVLFGS